MVDLPRLNTATQLTLITIRLWVREHLRGWTPVTHWDEGLIAAGLPLEARRALDELLTLLALMPDTLSGVLPLCAHRVSDNEFSLLAMLTECAADDAATPTLVAALPPTIKRLARQRCVSYTSAMAKYVCLIQAGRPPLTGNSGLPQTVQALPQRLH